MKPLILVAGILALGLKQSPVTTACGVDCFYDCVGSTCYDFGNHANFCQELRAKCQAQCSGQRSYGAIAYSKKDKGWGFSFKWPNQAKAETEAVKNCSAHGTKCESIVWYYNSCGAVAADGEVVTWGRDNVKAKAEQTAMSECTKAGGKKCVLQTSQCSRP